MPGFTTHYLFGLNAYHKLNSGPLKKSIRDRHAAFSLGLQGPDLFFYYPPSYFRQKNNIGSIAHTKDTNRFLKHLIESEGLFGDQPEAMIARAYIMGFLGHYLLDCKCHPYVYCRSRYRGKSPGYLGDHMKLEVDIDSELLKFYRKKLPSSFRQDSTILLNGQEVDTIAAILYYVYSKTYPELNYSRTAMRLAIRSMQLGARLLWDPNGWKKPVVRKIESLIPGYPLLSPMIASDELQFYPDPMNTLRRSWHNPWKASMTSEKSLFDLMEEATGEYTDLLPFLFALFQPSDSARKQERLSKLLRLLGNRSYHSGLEL